MKMRNKLQRIVYKLPSNIQKQKIDKTYMLVPPPSNLFQFELKVIVYEWESFSI